MDGFLATLFLLALIFGPALGGEWYGRHETMKEAFERGHAVQCVGKRGYHWECDHD